jgi:hypothetical protein
VMVAKRERSCGVYPAARRLRTGKTGLMPNHFHMFCDPEREA